MLNAFVSGYITFLNLANEYKKFLRMLDETADYYYFCDSRNNIEISIIELVFQFNFRRDYECLLKNSDVLFGSGYKREI